MLSQGSVLGGLIFPVSIISLPKPIYKQEFAFCLVPVTRLCCCSALYVLQLCSAASPSIWPSCSMAVWHTGVRCKYFLEVTQSYPSIPGGGWGTGKDVGLGI